MLKYKRILLKVSGEALSSGHGIDDSAVKNVARQIKSVVDLGVEVGVVVGGGNFWRGRQNNTMDRGTADYIGMLATVMNALALGEGLTSCGVENRVVTALAMDKIAEPYFLPKVLKYLEQGKVVVFGAGTGSPYFSTDTTSALRACEIHADALLCAKNIDGVYDSDPKFNSKAHKYDTLTYTKVLTDNLKALDLTAVAMCREYNIPVVAFGMDVEDGIVKVVCGEKIGTTITN